jgi:hypothetical protein
MSDDPRPNEKAPIKNEGQLSPPIVGKPIYECAHAVYVDGFVPHAVVTVYANGVEVVGKAQPYFGHADIGTTRALVPGDVITATQTAFGFTSKQSYVGVTVGHQPKTLGTPAVGPEIYACGQIVWVSGLTPSTRVEVYQAPTQPVAMTPGYLIGNANCTGAWVPVLTSPLALGWYVAARQISCPGTAHEIDSGPSASLIVPPDPSPMEPPLLEAPIVGNDAVGLGQLYTGAAITVTDDTTSKTVGGGFATASGNWVSVSPDVAANDKYHAIQALCSKSGPSPSIPATKTLAAPVLFSPICPDSTWVTLDGTVINATVVVYRITKPDMPGRVGPPDTVIAIGGAVSGELVLNLGPNVAGSLNVGDQLYAAQYIGGAVISARSNVVTVADCRNVITQHNNMRRTGAYLHETTLTPTFVGGKNFGRLYERNVTGSPYAQILYVRGVKTSKLAKTTKNLFVVATSTNDVYAFDADDHSTSASTPPVWTVNLGQTRLLNNNEICPETIGTVGVTSTPVIDVAAQRIYVLAAIWPGKTTPTPAGNVNLNQQHWLFALRLTDGKIMNQVQVGGTDPSTNITFDPSVQRNRPGLLLLAGSVYAGFATFSCDGGVYHGWVFGYAADTFAPTGIFCTSDMGDRGCGVWQSGNGLVGSDAGYIYFETGNDINVNAFTPGPGYTVPKLGKYADAFVRLRIQSNSPGLVEAGRFQPSNALRLRDGDRDAQGNALDPMDPYDNGHHSSHWGDTDLGSGGPVLLPGPRLVGGGKQGRYYVIQANTVDASGNLQLAQDQVSPDPAKVGEGFQAFFNTDRNVAGDKTTNYDIYAAAEPFGPNIHGGPCYWPGPSLIFQMPEKDYLKSFSYDLLSLTVNETPVRIAAVKPPYGMPGGHSSLSANHDKDGIVWTCMPLGDGMAAPVQGTIYAFDALTLKQIWQDKTPEWFAKFNPPTIADGKVFRPVFAQYGNAPTWAAGQPAPTVLGPGKVVVYGDMTTKKGAEKKPGARGAKAASAPPAAAEPPRLTIKEKWQRFGGSGVLTKQVGRETKIATKPAGLRRDYAGFVGSRKRRVSLRVELPDVTFHRRPSSAVPISSSVFWSAATGAHIVMGEIRDEYLKQGGPKGRLGYPVSDEQDTADHQGRVSFFEHGDITWTPQAGASTRVV